MCLLLVAEAAQCNEILTIKGRGERERERERERESKEEMERRRRKEMIKRLRDKL